MENTKNQNQQIDFTSVNNELQAFHKLLDDAERKTFSPRTPRARSTPLRAFFLPRCL